MNRIAEKKIALLGVAGVLANTCLLLLQRQGTVFPRDPYWRYQGVILARNLLEQPFSDHSFLLQWANNFNRDIASPILVAVFSELLNLPVNEVFWYPGFIVVLSLGQAVVAKELFRKEAAFWVTLLLTSGFRFLQTHILEIFSRVSLGWALFFWLLYIILRMANTSEQHQSLWNLAFIIVLFTFTISYSTLSVSSLVFWSVLVFLIKYKSTARGNIPIAIIFISVFTYLILIFPWLSGVVLVLVSDSARVAGQTIASEYPSYVFHNSLPTLYKALSISARLAAVGLVIGAGALLLRDRFQKYSPTPVYNISELSLFEIFLIASAVQGVAGFLVGRLFAVSGGLSPFLFGLLIAPIAGVKVVQAIGEVVIGNQDVSSSMNTLMVVILLICIIAPGFTLVFWETTDPQRISYSYSEKDRAAIDWTSSGLVDGRVFSDFNTVSAMYYLDSPPYQQTLVGDFYEARSYLYSDPSAVRTESDSYLVTSVIVEDYMIHIGSSTATIPNPTLPRQLNSVVYYNKVYTSGNNSTIYRDS